MNRTARRSAAATQRRQSATKDPPTPLDRAAVVRLFAGMAADDPRISGGTLIEPSGEVSFLNAELLRRGGSA